MVSRCTFTGNWSGVDDDGKGSTYVESIFWKNTLKGGISQGSRYELDIDRRLRRARSFIHGDVADLRGAIDRKAQHIRCAGPAFRRSVRSAGAAYANVGYRPVERPAPLPGRCRADPTALERRPRESILIGACTICFLPDGHATSMRSTASLAAQARSRAATDAVRQVAGIAVHHLRVGRAAGRDLDDGAEAVAVRRRPGQPDLDVAHARLLA